MKAYQHPGRRFLGTILACAGLASLALQPAAHAAMLRPLTTPRGVTMHETYRVLTTGLRVPSSGITTITLMKGGKDTLAAPRAIPGATPGTAYAFLFWDINGQLYARPMATFAAPTSRSAFAATAWYIPTGGGGSGPTAVTTFGFSLIKDKPLPGTPIASVAPSSAWTAPSSSVSTTTAVTITAVNPVTFVRWLAPGAAATGPQLAVGAGVSTLAIAFYGPNPCQYIQNELSSLSVADFGPPDPAKEYQAAAHALAAELHACEARHGAA